jgi:hypothetical protein
VLSESSGATSTGATGSDAVCDPMENETTPIARRTVLATSAGFAGATVGAGCTETATTYERWGDVDEIGLDADAAGWRGRYPAAIEGDENPTLVLYEDREYELTVRNGDGERHTLDVRDQMAPDQSRQTIALGAGDAAQTVSLRAVPSITRYVCDVHDRPSSGEIEIRPEGDTDTPLE